MAAGLAGAIGWLDCVTGLTGAIAVLYAVVLVLLHDSAILSRRGLLISALACAALTILSVFGSPGGPSGISEPLWIAVALAANALTTWLLLSRAGKAVLKGPADLRGDTVLDVLTVPICEYDFQAVQDAIRQVRATGIDDFRAYIADHPDFVVAARRTVRIIDVNPSALSLMGVPSKAAGLARLREFLPGDEHSFAACLIAIDERWSLFEARTQLKAADGRLLDVVAAFGLGPDVALDRAPVSLRDVTRERALEAVIADTRLRLAGAERFSALGTLSATLAHELNQPLSAINSLGDAASRWLQRDPPRPDEALAALSYLRDAVEQACGVLQRVRSVVGDAAVDLKPVDLVKIAHATVGLLQRDPEAEGVEMIVTAARPRILVAGDAILLKQLLSNLIGNARQAMAATGSPKRRVWITIGAGEAFIDLEVSDSGPGWGDGPPEAAFEPFYTRGGGGMGLGLSICRSIARLHRAEITLGTATGGGASVRLRFECPSSQAYGTREVGDPAAA